MRIAAVAASAAKVVAANQAGDLDPRHHHRVAHGGDGAGGGGGGGGGEADEQQQQHNHRLLQFHQEEQDQEPPSAPVFQLQHLQATALSRQRASSAEYALLASMGDAGQSHSHSHLHHGGFQPQLLSFGGVGQQHHHHLHQFTAQAPAGASHSRSRAAGGGGGGEAVPASQSSSRVRSAGGEIVAVQGGHIVRATGRKDRHSKVCTSRGPRDRRVRLSAHTAIQFYDVQDRLGYDRPSKAVDWLIKNAKEAIDKLEVLPAWQPTNNAAAGAALPPSSSTHPDSAENSDDQAQAITVAHAGFDFPTRAEGGGAADAGGGTAFLPSSLDSDSIADTIKSFFPVGGGTAGGEASSSTAVARHSSAMRFQSYTPDLLSRTGSHSQDLRLSLPDPPMFQHQQQEHDHDRSHGHGGNVSTQQALFPGAGSYSFGVWAEQAQSQRMLPWSVPDPGGGSGYLFNVSQQAAALGGQSQFLFQRGPLQSSTEPSDRGWPESVEADNPMSAIGFAPGIGFSGFRVPARIQGEEEHNGSGNGDKPSPPPAVSSASHH